MKYVVLGASAAGVNGVRQLRKRCPKAEIVLVSADSSIYSRCILHQYMSGIRTLDQLCFAELDFQEKYKVDWRRGVSCVSMDQKTRTLNLSDGSQVSYHKLLAATGSHTFLPPVKGLREAKGVYGFRNIEDAAAIRDQVGQAGHIVVMGGGLTGLDAAIGFLHMGKKVTVVEMADRLLVKQLDHYSAHTYEKALERQGITMYLGNALQEVVMGEDGHVSSLILSGNVQIPCTMLVVTAGVRSNVEFLEGSGIACDRFGLLIDERGRTSDPDVYGAGDVTGRSPIWPAAVKQGIIAADNMAGFDTAEGHFFASRSTMNFLGIPTMSLGVPEKPDDTYQEVTERKGSIYRKVIHRDGRICGAILQGDLSYGGVLTQIIARGIDISKVRKPLFNIDYSDFFHIDKNLEFYYESPRRRP